MQASKVGSDTQLSTLISLMENAATEKPPIVLLADKHASRFLTIILIIAAFTAIGWFYIDSSRALWIAVSVIVVTCPCALSLATPGVMSAAIGLLAKNGVLIRNGKAIQAMAEATHFVFDKTGTLTVGKLRVSDTMVLREHVQAEAIAFAMASGSTHPAAKAIADSLAAQHAQSSAMNSAMLQEIAGGGVEAEIGGRLYRLGNADFVSEITHTDFVAPAACVNKTLSMLADKEGVILLFAMADVLRDDAVEAIQKLKAAGKNSAVVR
jgi:Cu2+-exporting ATPase